MKPSADIRCPTCRKLLARRTNDGAFEIRRDHRLLAIVYSGGVRCPVCEITITVGAATLTCDVVATT